MVCFTLKQFGLIAVLIGTICLAFSVKTIGQYNGKQLSELKERNPEKKLWAPTCVTIIRPLFWFGIFLVIVGTALQW
jgi:hypothetical protein